MKVLKFGYSGSDNRREFSPSFSLICEILAKSEFLCIIEGLRSVWFWFYCSEIKGVGINIYKSNLLSFDLLFMQLLFPFFLISSWNLLPHPQTIHSSCEVFRFLVKPPETMVYYDNFRKDFFGVLRKNLRPYTYAMGKYGGSLFLDFRSAASH